MPKSFDARISAGHSDVHSGLLAFFGVTIKCVKFVLFLDLGYKETSLGTQAVDIPFILFCGFTTWCFDYGGLVHVNNGHLSVSACLG